MQNKIVKQCFEDIKYFQTHYSSSDKLKYLSKIPLNIFKHTFYFISILLPRRKDIWVFGSWNGIRFSDNSKYLFLHVSNNHINDVMSIFLSKDKKIIKELRDYGYNAYYLYGLRGMYYNLRAKYIFSDASFDSVNFWCCGGATKVQLGHGLPLKKIGKDFNSVWNGPLSKFIFCYFNPWTFTKYDYVISTSYFFKDKFSYVYSVKKENVLITGYPRNDVIFDHVKGENLIDTEVCEKMSELRSDHNSKIILYMPTFRDDEFFSNKKPNFDKVIEFEKMNNFLNQTNSIFIVKPHPLIKIDSNLGYNRIIFLPSNFDIYSVLSQIDILVTDYSSICFDFLLTDKPIIYFPYDLDEYINEGRGLHVNYEEFTPGPKAYTFKELLDWMDYFIKGNDEFVHLRKNMKNLAFDNVDGKSSERIYAYIYNL